MFMESLLTLVECLLMFSSFISEHSYYATSPGWLDSISSWLFPKAFLWMVNALVVGLVLAKLLVYGEPITRKNSSASVQYWRHRRQATVDMERVSLYLGREISFW